jgi:hypothetical protein
VPVMVNVLADSVTTAPACPATASSADCMSSVCCLAEVVSANVSVVAVTPSYE